MDRLAWGSMVAVEVGAGKKQFLIHKNLLLGHASDFFTAALCGQFVEAQTDIIILPEEEPAAFELFVDWLYRGRIPDIPVKDGWGNLSFKAMETEGFLDVEATYHDLYYMAEKWCIVALKTHIMDRIRRFHFLTDTTVHPSLIEAGYVNTAEGSTMREYLSRAGAFALKYPSSDYVLGIRNHLQSSSQDFLLDVLGIFRDGLDVHAIKDPDCEGKHRSH